MEILVPVPTPGPVQSPETMTAAAFVPNPLPPKLPDRDIANLALLVTEADRAMTRLAGELQSLPDVNILLNPMQQRDIQASSKIENTVSTLKDLAISEVAPQRVASEAVEVRNNRRALESGIDSKLPLCGRLLRDMHRVLLDGVPGNAAKSPGEFRTRQLQIGGTTGDITSARFVPPPAGPLLDQCLVDYERFLNPQSHDRHRYPFLMELALSHYQFETIHPFCDGNGRPHGLNASPGTGPQAPKTAEPFHSDPFDETRQCIVTPTARCTFY